MWSEVWDDAAGRRRRWTPISNDQGEAAGTATADALRELHRQHIFQVPYEDGPPAPGRAAAVRPGRLSQDRASRRGGPVSNSTRRSRSCCGHWVSRWTCWHPGVLRGKLAHCRATCAAVLTADSPEPWLADVVRPGVLHPVRLDSRAEQADPHGVYRFVDGEYGDIDLVRTGEPQYRGTPGPAPTTTSGRWVHRRARADSPPIVYLYARAPRRRRIRSGRQVHHPIQRGETSGS